MMKKLTKMFMMFMPIAVSAGGRSAQRASHGMDAGVDDVALSHDEGDGTGKADHEHAECDLSETVAEQLADLVGVVAGNDTGDDAADEEHAGDELYGADALDDGPDDRRELQAEDQRDDLSASGELNGNEFAGEFHDVRVVSAKAGRGVSLDFLDVADDEERIDHEHDQRADTTQLPAGVDGQAGNGLCVRCSRSAERSQRKAGANGEEDNRGTGQRIRAECRGDHQTEGNKGHVIRLGDTHAAENRERSHDDGNGDGQLAARSVGDRTDRRVKRLGGVEDADGTGDDEGANDQHGRVDAGLRDVHDHLPGTDGGLINVVERIGVDNVLPVYLHKIVGTSGNDVGCDGCHHEQNEKDDKHMGHCKLFFLFHFLLSPCCFLFGRMPVRFSFSSDVLCIAAFRIGAMLLSLPFR